MAPILLTTPVTTPGGIEGPGASVARGSAPHGEVVGRAALQHGFSRITDNVKMRILVVDDEPAVRVSLGRALRLKGYEVGLAPGGAEAFTELEAQRFDAVVLDVLMPAPDGLEVCRTLRRSGSRIPILMLTAREAVEHRIEGLDAGADDYLSKPFALSELCARLEALVRRPTPQEPLDAGECLCFADLVLYPEAHEARRGDRRIDLTRTEFALLELFMRNPRQILSRRLILDRVWDAGGSMSPNLLEVFVSYLRRKLEDGGHPRLIQTVRGAGYSLRLP